MDIFYLILPHFIRNKFSNSTETILYCTILYWCGGSNEDDMSCFITREFLTGIIPEIKSTKQITRLLTRFKEAGIIDINRKFNGLFLRITAQNLTTLGLTQYEMEAIMKTFSKKKKVLLECSDEERRDILSLEKGHFVPSEGTFCPHRRDILSPAYYIKNKEEKIRSIKKEEKTEISYEISEDYLNRNKVSSVKAKQNTLRKPNITRLLKEYSELYQKYFNKIPDISNSYKTKKAFAGIRANLLEKHTWAEYIEFCFNNWSKLKQVLVWEDSGKQKLADHPNLFEITMGYKQIMQCMEEGMPDTNSDKAKDKLESLGIKIVKVKEGI